MDIEKPEAVEAEAYARRRIFELRVEAAARLGDGVGDAGAASRVHRALAAQTCEKNKRTGVDTGLKHEQRISGRPASRK